MIDRHHCEFVSPAEWTTTTLFDNLNFLALFFIVSFYLFQVPHLFSWHYDGQWERATSGPIVGKGRWLLEANCLLLGNSFRLYFWLARFWWRLDWTGMAILVVFCCILNARILVEEGVRFGCENGVNSSALHASVSVLWQRYFVYGDWQCEFRVLK